MHSKVANNLAKQKLLYYLKYTDANGIERSTNIAEWNGRTVFVTDSVPNKYVAGASKVPEVLGVKTITIAGSPTVGDTITVNSKRYTIVNTKHTEFELALGSGTAVTVLFLLMRKVAQQQQSQRQHLVLKA